MEATPDLRRFALLAHAVAGRPLAIALAGAGELAHTDGRTIYVAPGDPAEQLRQLVLQASLVAARSLRPDAVRRLRGRPSAARRYLSLEGRRALRETAAFLGVARELAAACGPGSTSRDQALAWALGREPVPELPDFFGVLRPRRLLAAATGGTGTAVSRVTRPAAESFQLPENDEDADTQELGRIARLLQSPLGGRGPMALLLARLLDLGREPDAGSAVAGMTGAVGARSEAAPRRPIVVPGPVRVVPRAGPAPLAAARYPEWFETERRYRPAWCAVFERSADAGVPVAVPRIRFQRAARRQLARLGLGFAPSRRQREGEELHLDALVSSCVDRLLGNDASEKIYVRQQRGRRDLGLLVLLDASGSGADRGEIGGSVYAAQRATAATLVAAAEAQGDRVALLGFRSRGRDQVHLLRVKGFDDRFDAAARRRLEHLEPGAFTRLGAAIRHATWLLRNRAGTPRKLLVVCSDGFPYDEEYEGRHAQADTRRSLAEAQRAGVGSVCLGIGTGQRDAALLRTFGSAAVARAPDLGALVPRLGRLFRRALESAERQQAARGAGSGAGGGAAIAASSLPWTASHPLGPESVR